MTVADRGLCSRDEATVIDRRYSYSFAMPFMLTA